mmetsp:Transcript_1011/g.1046  ORF Transcript_1011/g.1046 Transcript_1011/m.1046 type:complete len:86 (+) Transcript_1011:178-435(+)
MMRNPRTGVMLNNRDKGTTITEQRRKVNRSCPSAERVEDSMEAFSRVVAVLTSRSGNDDAMVEDVVVTAGDKDDIVSMVDAAMLK